MGSVPERTAAIFSLMPETLCSTAPIFGRMRDRVAFAVCWGENKQRQKQQRRRR